MNKLRLLSLLFAALFVVTMSGCNKDDDEVEPNKNQLLTAHPWQGSSVYLDGFIDKDNSFPLEITTFKVTFKNDRTFTASFKVNGVPQMAEGLWDLKENNTKMNFPVLNEVGEDSEVMRLTATNFDISTIFTDANGQKHALELRFVPAK